MSKTKKSWMVPMLLAVAAGAAILWGSGVSASSEGVADEAKIATLVHEMESMGKTRFEAMESIPIRRFELPGAGVDVMRARLRETYTVDGVGTDTVELSGWIAVKHGAARPAAGFTDLNWNTAVVPTEFVGMDLRGYSQVFGPVHISLDESRPVTGQVGRIEVPETAKLALTAKLEKNSAAPRAAKGRTTKTGKATAGKPSGPTARTGKARVGAQDKNGALEIGLCEAKLNARIEMPDLGLEMTTKSPVLWYSLVDTIPPVGHTASIAIEPVRLTADGREVATLESGIVDFREVVRHVSLSEGADRVAATGAR